ncbi:MAG: class I SAM-dependent methyltransferase [Actinomycetes bacterium]
MSHAHGGSGRDGVLGPPRSQVDYARDLRPEQIQSGAHRRRVGGLWDSLGKMQRDFLVEHGLRPEHRLLDVGCGALRAGRHLAAYLEPGHYYGIDINRSLLDAGYDRELPDHLRKTLSRDNLRATGRFDVDFAVPFEFALAHSVFTHVPLNHIRLCLFRVAKAMPPGGRFYATYFEAPADFPLDGVRPGRRAKRTERNPFLYYREDLGWAASFSPWKVRYLGAWGHPRGQRMIEFTRVKRSPKVERRRRARRLVLQVPGTRSLYRTVRG